MRLAVSPWRKVPRYAKPGITYLTGKRFTATPVVMAATVPLLANNRKVHDMKLSIEYKGAAVTVESESRLDLSGLNAFLDTLTQTAPAKVVAVAPGKPAAKRRGRPKGTTKRAK